MHINCTGWWKTAKRKTAKKKIAEKEKREIKIQKGKRRND
jgi:hypothetical protein